MPRVKVKRASTTIDMTAMCDVSFLLLTFFILTATAREPEPLPVDTPASVTQVKVPDDDLGLITVGDGGKVFFGVVNRNARSRMLELMSEKYSIPFTPEEKAKFSTMETFGVPIGNLKQLINMGPNDRVKPGLQPGIPVDSTDALSNELFHWIYSARVATKELKNTEMRVSIKGDAEEKYPEIKKVIDVLQSQKVNKFSLITSLRAGEGM
ncbi:biopolymer transporter ExbD [Parapedobacter defluvii]|uniref:Biopolymer transporter ExbD n=1 Tax=Parapedobacter defluvii TaxID=2045106 RepID=A0ABQ1LWF4_9SPHI|nr:biopolymer transporter ExbD [Parapedobacter defluvii]RQP19696.1 MAG: biopolymer transporter ExbD [Parapedobacter sp.]GGC30731.1 biopolymer transporter ExbD [Parapedobacter defluvii]